MTRSFLEMSSDGTMLRIVLVMAHPSLSSSDCHDPTTLTSILIFESVSDVIFSFNSLSAALKSSLLSIVSTAVDVAQ